VSLYDKDMILGIDEVGRGPWAGPLVVGAVVLGGAAIEGLADSKVLTAKRREQLASLIREQAAGFGLGWVTPAEIDKLGLSESLRLATRRAVEQINTPYHEIVIDGTINFLAGTSKETYVTTLKKADSLVPAVSAASILAKVARDAYMVEQAKVYPTYGFETHVGYGTARHIAAIKEYGVTPLHRLSFGPLKDYRGTTVHKQTVGNAAEHIAAQYLRAKGFQILARNWKTKYAEIDIVAEREGTIYFVEVKYRRSDRQGGGMAAITPTKLHKMTLGAEAFIQQAHHETKERKLAVVTLTGNPPRVEDFLELE